MTQTINDNIITARLFVEQISLDGDVLVPTGKVVEVDFFNSLIWSTSADFKKSGTVSFENALEKLTSSLKHPDSSYKSSVIPDDIATEAYATLVHLAYKDRQINFNPEQTGDNPDFLLSNDFLLGCNSLEGYVSTAENLPVCFVPSQRVWILSTSICPLDLNDAGLEKRTNVWAGVVTGFSDNFSEGGCTVSVSLSGISRFLEMVDIFQNHRISTFMDTNVNAYVEILNEKLYSKFTGAEMLTSLSPVSYMMLSVFLANYYLTAQGNAVDYSQNDSTVLRARNSKFFMQEPLWRLQTDEAHCWESLVDAQVWDLGGKAVPYSSQTDFNTTVESLLSGKEVFVWQLVPSAYVDPLIVKLFTSDELKIMPRILQQSFDLIDTSSISAKDLLVKVAQAIMGTVYEDDFGNIVLEVSKLWSAPQDGSSFIPEPYYRNSISFKSFLTDTDQGRDYIISDADYFNHNKSFNEANIVTHVEVPTGYFQNIEPNEVVNTIYLTGRTSVENTEDVDNSDILKLQRRFGVRVLTAAPITSSVVNLFFDSYPEYRKALDAYAKTLLKLRNYASEALTLETRFLHHLAVNKNVLWLHDEALWLIKDKTLTYTLGEKSASYSCSFVLSFRHKLYEKASYPFLDLYIAAGV